VDGGCSCEAMSGWGRSCEAISGGQSTLSCVLRRAAGTNVCGFRSSNGTAFPVTLTCGPSNGVIASVAVGVYGEYSGYCGSIAPGKCSSPTAASAISAACVGKGG